MWYIAEPYKHATDHYSYQLKPFRILTIWYMWPFISTACISLKKKKTSASAMRMSFLGHKEIGNGRNNEQYSFNVYYNCTIFYLNFETFLWWPDHGLSAELCSHAYIIINVDVLPVAMNYFIKMQINSVLPFVSPKACISMSARTSFGKIIIKFPGLTQQNYRYPTWTSIVICPIAGFELRTTDGD